VLAESGLPACWKAECILQGILGGYLCLHQHVRGGDMVRRWHSTHPCMGAKYWMVRRRLGSAGGGSW
jgi:hypothetical protein